MVWCPALTGARAKGAAGSRFSRNDGGGGYHEDSVRSHRDRVLSLRAGCPHKDLMATRRHGGHPQAPTKTNWHAVHLGLPILWEPKKQDPRGSGKPLLSGKGGGRRGNASGLECLAGRTGVAAHVIDTGVKRKAIRHPGDGIVIRQGGAWGVVEAGTVRRAGGKVRRWGQAPRDPPPPASVHPPPIPGGGGLR